MPNISTATAICFKTYTILIPKLFQNQNRNLALVTFLFESLFRNGFRIKILYYPLRKTVIAAKKDKYQVLRHIKRPSSPHKIKIERCKYTEN